MARESGVETVVLDVSRQGDGSEIAVLSEEDGPALSREFEIDFERLKKFGFITS